MQLHLLGSIDMAAFQSEEDCEKFLMKSRWDHSFFCPRCDHEEFYRVKTRNLLECRECRTQISITAGTIMHKSKLPLLLWFKAIRLLIEDKLIYSIPAFASELGVNYRTAKLLLEKLQLALDKKRALRGNDVEQDQQSEVESSKKKKSTSSMAKFLFKTKRNVRYSDQVIFSKWMDACFSVYLYPHFLGYFQVR